MIKPKDNKLVHRFFAWYIKHIIKKDFHNFFHNTINIEPDKAILLLANHCSWWDGFLLFYLNKLYFKKHFHVMIVEETAQKLWFMKYLGAFSINKKSRTIISSLKYAGELLNNPDNLVLIFPQGKLFSSHSREIIFEKGVSHIIQNSTKQFQYIFAVILFDYFQNRKPSVAVHLKKWESQEYTSLQVIKSEFNKHFDEAKQLQSKQTV